MASALSEFDGICRQIFTPYYMLEKLRPEQSNSKQWAMRQNRPDTIFRTGRQIL
jgi:hypothetical protein